MTNHRPGSRPPLRGLETSSKVDPKALMRAHYALQKGVFFSVLDELEGGIVCGSKRSVVPMWNHAAWCGGTAEQWTRFVDETDRWQTARGARPYLYIHEPDAGQLAILRAKGYERFDEEAWMIRSAAGTRSETVFEAHDPCELAEAAHVFARAFSVRDKGYAEAFGERCSLRHFLLRSGEKYLCVGSLGIQGKLAGIYNVGTIPEARKMGFGRKMINHLLAVAQERGCTEVFLQVENSTIASRLYEACGFVKLFTRIGFRGRSDNPEKCDATLLSRIIGVSDGEGTVVREARPIPMEIGNWLRELEVGKCECVLAAAWAYLLHRYTGQDSVTFALENRTAIVRQWSVKVPQLGSVRDWIKEMRTCNSIAPNPFQADSCLTLNSRTECGGSDFPIILQLDPESPAVLQANYREGIFEKDSVRRLASHFVRILQSIHANPGALVRDVEILTEDERQQLLVGWNKVSFTPTGESLARLFEEQVEKTPEAVAVILAEKEGGLTYRQLNRRANRLAHQLQKMGVGPEISVGVLLPRSIESVIALLAILKAGGVYVPLDAASPKARLSYILDDSQAAVLITLRAQAEGLIPPRGCKSLCLDDPNEAGAACEKNPISKTRPHDAAYIIYTSGSTGQPKGVVVTQHALANHSVDCCQQYGLSSKDRVLQFSSFNFDASLEQLLPPLLTGATVVVRGEALWNGRQFSEKLREYGLTLADLPTAYWHNLVEFWAAKPLDVLENQLRLVIVGGEAMSRERVATWHRIFRGRPRLLNAYGPTETTITATSFELSADSIEANQVLIGRPRGDRKLYVLDGLGRPVPIGIPGELYISGSLLGRGYHRRPKLTAERFLQNPFTDDPESRIYRTGDLVRYRADGSLEFLGRVDDQVKLRGFRIELGEIESALCQHPGVRDAVVLASTDVGGEKRLVAFVKRIQSDLIEAELREHLRRILPDYMVPSSVDVLEEWPLLPSGKIDRKGLLARSAQRRKIESFSGPKEPLELQVQILFERVLKRTPIGIDQSFFELGGDSLQALELLVQIEKETGTRLPLETLFQAATVEVLAAQLKRTSTRDGGSCLVPLQAGGTRPALVFLHTTPGDVLGYGNLVYRLGAEQPCYGIQSLGLLESERIHTSIEAMAEYYAGLLQEFQPHGPYYLAGWCYGGIVAVEMARILRERGENIGLLALLETVAAPAPLWNYKYYSHRLGRLLSMSPRRWATYFREKIKHQRNSRIADRMRFRQAEAGGQDVRLAQLERVYKANMKALSNYRSRPYPGTVTLFNASEKDPALIPDPKYGWVGLADQIEIYEVPGNHDTMLGEPNVCVLAQQLREALQRAQSIKTGP